MNNKIIEYLDEIRNFAKNKGIHLSAGNCGTFALSFQKFLSEKNIETRIVVFCSEYGVDINDPEIAYDLFSADELLYHVALVDKDGLLYDGDGQISEDHIYSWIKEEYGESRDYVYRYDFKEGTDGVDAYIKNETNWSISDVEFDIKIKNALENKVSSEYTI